MPAPILTATTCTPAFPIMQTPPTSPSSTKMPAPPRPLLPLPTAAATHSTTFLEESLFSQAFTLLTSCLTSGSSTYHPAYIPVPAVLSLAATLSVHPNYTTRTADKDRQRDADAAGRYLRAVVDIVGGRAVEGGLREAFSFREDVGRRKSGGRGKRGGAVDSGVDGEGERILAGRYAGQQSLWSNVGDFWGLVGWAFNCSVRHKGRWERWRALLEVLIDVLERDLEASGEVKFCLLMRYMEGVGGGRNDKRRIMRAILADGTEKSMNEFGEVWRDETRPPKVEPDDGSKKRKLDLENGEYGDYFDDDSAAEDDNPTTSSTRRSRSTNSKRGPSTGSSDIPSTSTPSSIMSFGGPESLRLRQRLLALLAQLSHLAPKLFGSDLSDMWSLYTEFLRSLPLPIFQQFISPAQAYLSPSWQASLCEMMSRSLLGVSGSYGIVTVETFERDIAGGTASNTSAVDQAKVGVLVESLLRLLWVQGFLESGAGDLRETIEEGIEKRQAKASWRKKGGSEDEEAREVLRIGGERLKVLVKLICG